MQLAEEGVEGSVNYYTILEATNALMTRHRWVLRRCRRRSDGLHYIVVDANGQMRFAPHRRLGLTLQELLMHLSAQEDVAFADEANRLLVALNEFIAP